MENADTSLTLDQKVMLKALLQKHSTVFSTGPMDMGRTSLIYHKLNSMQKLQYDTDCDEFHMNNCLF